MRINYASVNFYCIERTHCIVFVLSDQVGRSVTALPQITITMDVLRAVLITPHTDLYEYGSGKSFITLRSTPEHYLILKTTLSAANYGSPLPFYLWPSAVLGLIVTYLLLVKVLLPIHMKDRKPYNLRGFMLTYNALQLVANLYICTFVSWPIDSVVSGSVV